MFFLYGGGRGMMDIVWVILLLGGIAVGIATGKGTEMTQALMDGASQAVELCIRMAGVCSLWLGLMEIMRRAGWVDMLARRMGGVLRWLFPDIPAGHPALGAISMNLAANVLGMGNAATPLGIKAMEHLQTLNRCPDTASAAMCMFLVINTASIQLIPTGLMTFRHAMGSSQAGIIVLPTLVSTAVSAGVGILIAGIFQHFSRRRRP